MKKFNEFIFDEKKYNLEMYGNFKEDYHFWLVNFLCDKTEKLSKRMVSNTKTFTFLVEQMKDCDNIEQLREHCNSLSKIGFSGLKQYHNPCKRLYDFMCKYDAEYITQINTGALKQMLKHECKDIAPITRRNVLREIKNFLVYIEENSIDENRDFTFHLKKDIGEVIPREEKEKGFIDPHLEYDRLYNSIDEVKFEDKIAARNRLLLKFIMLVGFRVSELTNIEISKIQFSDSLEFLDIKIIGKGNVEYTKHVEFKFVEKDYREWLTIKEKESWNSPLLFVTTKNKKIYDNYINKLVQKILLKAGIKDKGKKGPHLLRHATATRKHSEGHDIIRVQEFMHHKDLRTTRIYLHSTTQDRQEVSRKKEIK